MNNADTLPKSLVAGYQKYGDRKMAMRQKDLGIWRSYTWQDSYEQVRQLSLGLISLGLERGDKVCIIGDNDPQYFWAQLAIQAGGGVAVGIFTDSAPREIQYIVRPFRRCVRLCQGPGAVRQAARDPGAGPRRPARDLLGRQGAVELRRTLADQLRGGPGIWGERWTPSSRTSLSALWSRAAARTWPSFATPRAPRGCPKGP